MGIRPIFTAILLLICTTAFAQPKTTFTDPRDGKTYKTAKIGEQTWLAENLNYEAEGSKFYRDSIPNCEKFGRLYNWETATKVCPSGWHLPSQGEWGTLRANDVSEFSGLLGGLCNSSDICYHIGQRGSWWSTKISSTTIGDNQMKSSTKKT